MIMAAFIQLGKVYQKIQYNIKFHYNIKFYSKKISKNSYIKYNYNYKYNCKYNCKAHTLTYSVYSSINNTFIIQSGCFCFFCKLFTEN